MVLRNIPFESPLIGLNGKQVKVVESPEGDLVRVKLITPAKVNGMWNPTFQVKTSQVTSVEFSEWADTNLLKEKGKELNEQQRQIEVARNILRNSFREEVPKPSAPPSVDEAVTLPAASARVNYGLPIAVPETAASARVNYGLPIAVPVPAASARALSKLPIAVAVEPPVSTKGKKKNEIFRKMKKGAKNLLHKKGRLQRYKAVEQNYKP
jgi:hypothetical protein